MSNQRIPIFQREYASVLAARLGEPRRFFPVVAGPRQVGKTTLVEQVLTASGSPNVYASADEPTLRDTAWLTAQWDRARPMADEAAGAVLALDEIQKIPSGVIPVRRP